MQHPIQLSARETLALYFERKGVRANVLTLSLVMRLLCDEPKLVEFLMSAAREEKKWAAFLTNLESELESEFVHDQIEAQISYERERY